MTVAGKNKRPIIALDLGTTKFCLAMLRPHADQGAPQVETCAVPADGMRRGMLSSMEQANDALCKLVDAAEKQFGCDIHQVIVGVAGSHLKGRRVRYKVPLNSNVAPSDIARLIRHVETHEETDERELLHVVPLGYRLNHGELIDDPTGFSGPELHGEFFVIDADRFYLKDIVSLCNKAGLRVTKLYSEPFASASVTVPDGHKDVGVAVADIGGGTTDGIIFQRGKPVYAFTVNVAGKLMTNDLAIGLTIPFDDAEKIKTRFGIKPRTATEAQPVRTLKGAIKRVDSRDINPILVPRVYELGGLLRQELKAFDGLLGAGLMLTGGGAEVKGIDEFYSKILNLPVTKARPSLIPKERQYVVEDTEHVHLNRKLPPSKFATAIGLVNLELCREAERKDKPKSGFTRRTLGQFVNWLKELT